MSHYGGSFHAATGYKSASVSFHLGPIEVCTCPYMHCEYGLSKSKQTTPDRFSPSTSGNCDEISREHHRDSPRDSSDRRRKWFSYVTKQTQFGDKAE